MSEIDEQMQLPPSAADDTVKLPKSFKTPSPINVHMSSIKTGRDIEQYSKTPPIARSTSHPLPKINMNAPPITYMKSSNSAVSSCTSPIDSNHTSSQTPAYNHSHIQSPPHSHKRSSHSHSHNRNSLSSIKVQMPNENNMLSYSSTATTPSTGAAASPVTPNRNPQLSLYHPYGSQSQATTPIAKYQRRSDTTGRRSHPLSIPTTPNSYHYRQSRSHSHSTSITHSHSHGSHAVNHHNQQQQHSNNHYAQTPTPNQPKQSHGAYHQLSMIPPSTNLYPSHSSGHNSNNNNSSHTYANTPYSTQHVIHNMGSSQTPTPGMSSRIRSRSISVTTTSSPNNKDYNNSSSASPQFPGSMTPQHHTRRRHTVHGHHASNNHYSHSNQGSPYHNGHGHNYNKQSRTEKIYSLLQLSYCVYDLVFPDRE